MDALKESLTNKFHTPQKKYTLQVDLFSIWLTGSPDKYIEKLNNLFNQLNIPIADRLHHFIFGLKSNLKQALLIWQPNTYCCYCSKKESVQHKHWRWTAGNIILKKLKHRQLLAPKEENITALVTSHHPIDLHKKIARMEQELRDLRKHRQLRDYLAVQPSYRNTNNTMNCRNFLKVGKNLSLKSIVILGDHNNTTNQGKELTNGMYHKLKITFNFAKFTKPFVQIQRKNTWHTPTDGHNNPRYQQGNTQPSDPALLIQMVLISV